MPLLDWMIVAIPLIIVALVALRARRYVRGVADFLAAGRVAGRYVVAVANGQAALGLISMVAFFEMYSKSGFALGFWGRISTPISILILLTGFAVYRFRETRALTMAQFLEIRYSRNFRIFAGLLQAASGIVNYGLFPAVGARFIMYFCDLPTQLHCLGLTWPTFGVIMVIFLSVAVIITTLGGQITIMTTDCIQGILGYPMYVMIVVAILLKFSWSQQMCPTLMDRPVGQSMMNPFDTYRLQDFNLFYVAIGIFGSVYNIMSDSGTQGYNVAAVSAHEQKMGKILGTWRAGFLNLMMVLLVVASYTYLKHADFAAQAAKTEKHLVRKTLSDVAPEHAAHLPSDPSDQQLQQQVDSLAPARKQVFDTLRNQMRVPMAIRDILPVGLTGLFCAVMIFLMISTDTTYLHSWGSIIVQDVVLPIRKKPFTPRQQLFWLRVVITLVAVYAFFFSLYFGQITFILFFFALTGSIWLGGAGAVILGGLYWEKGTASGAWAALLTGSILGVLGFLGTNYWVGWIYPALSKSPSLLHGLTRILEGLADPFRPIIDWRVTPDRFPINGQEVFFFTMAFSALVYLIVSLFTCREPFNMDRMLHRGQYRRQDDFLQTPSTPHKPPRSAKQLLRFFLGIDNQFTTGDKVLSWSVFIYGMGYGFAVWLIIVLWNFLFRKWPPQWWSVWFYIQYILEPIIVGTISTVWFTLGGIWGLKKMFQRLALHQSNILDDGRVVGHVNADDLDLVQQVEHQKPDTSCKS